MELFPHATALEQSKNLPSWQVSDWAPLHYRLDHLGGLMKIRRIVTGQSPAGKAVVISDGASPWVVDTAHVRGLRTELLWQIGNPPTVPSMTGADPALSASSLLPAPGATSIQIVTFPPDVPTPHGRATEAEIDADYAKAFPGLAERFEHENPGMHVTDTIDFCVVLEGELVMELDDGFTTVLYRNDVVIQNGTRHGWRNRSDRPARMLFVMIGASR